MSKDYIEINFIKSRYPKTYKFFTMFSGLISISIIFTVMSVYLFFLLNKQGAYTNQIIFIAWFILVYYIWWIIRGFEYIVFIVIASLNLLRFSKIDFKKVLFDDDKNLSKQEAFFKSNLKEDKSPTDIVHWFIIPTYKESIEILQETLTNLKNSNYDKSKYAVTICGEERDKDNFLKIADILKTKFKDAFGYLSVTIHPKDIPDEVIGKGANIKYGVSIEYQNILKAFDTTPDNVLVTTLDADTNIDKEYTNILTYTYLSSENRKYKSYQPMIFFFNNFWAAPFFSKIISIGNSFWILFNSTKMLGTRNFSTHAQPLDALIDLDFWSNQTIVEDGHQYRRSYFGFLGNYECVPIYTKVYQDCNLNDNFFLTAKAQYNQMRRWAHGAEDIAYVFCQFLYNFKKLPFLRTIYEILKSIEGVIMWATLHIVLMSGMIFTLIKDIQLSSFISLGKSISIFVNFSMLIMIFIIILGLLFSPIDKLKSPFEKFFQITKLIIIKIWLTGPILLIFSGLPALHTQIMLMIGKPMKKFNVTKKVRK